MLLNIPFNMHCIFAHFSSANANYQQFRLFGFKGISRCDIRTFGLGLPFYERPFLIGFMPHRHTHTHFTRAGLNDYYLERESSVALTFCANELARTEVTDATDLTQSTRLLNIICLWH